MSNIHPTAIVSKKASIGANIIVSPYAVIEDDVEIGYDCEIGPHAVIYDGARIGNKVIVKQGASVSNVPQDLKFDGEKSVLVIGDNTVVREFAALHRGTKETGVTKIGKNCLLMAYTHVAHDCTIGENCILSNSVQIGGHCTIENNVIVGGLTGVHQFCIIGEHSMVGATILVSQDVPPYILAGRSPAHYLGLNLVGLKRRGFKSEDIDIIKKVYTILYDKGMNVSQAVKVIDSDLGDNPYVKRILDFIGNSKRGIVGK
jgi:UDP-N-acetylglucosamine acyltransferase